MSYCLSKGGSNMNKTIVTYETFHGSAKKIAEIISTKLNCKCINIDTPFEAEDLREIDNIILESNEYKTNYSIKLFNLKVNSGEKLIDNEMLIKNILCSKEYDKNKNN